MSWRIRRTKFGMGLIAMREDEDKAATVGVNTPIYKLLGFVASAVFVGMAGAIYGYYLAFVDPIGMFSILLSVQILLSMLLGGRGTLCGPVLGAFLIEPLNEFVQQLARRRQRAAARLRRPDGAGRAVPAARDHPDAARPARGAAQARQGRAGRRAAGAARAPAPAARPALERPPLLEVKGLEKRFGGLRAVDGASFEVPEGSITALIGPNGSGKTTVFNLIGGTMAPNAGEVWFDGRRIDGLQPWERAHAGLGRTFQITRLFREMTVLENVVAPLRAFRWGQLNADGVSGSEAERAEELLDFVGMERFRDQQAAALSFGQQKLVELAQILMLDPKLILLDEPAGGINPTLIERMGEMIRELNARGQDVPDRRAQHAVRARALRPGARARARADDRRRPPGRDPARPEGARRLPGRRLRARRAGGGHA